MNKLGFMMVFIIVIGVISCTKVDPTTTNFKNLTSNIWLSDTLIANGEDASGPGQMLEKFKGEARFNEDGTGIFGQYDGEWHFAYDETKIVISSDSLMLPLTTNILELNSSSLKITTDFPNITDPDHPTHIRMTFNPR